MHQESLFPLRTIAGNPIDIALDAKHQPEISIVEQSDASRLAPIKYTWRLNDNLAATVHDPFYKECFPVLAIGPAGGAPAIVRPAAGMATMPVPREPPFAADARVLSLFARSSRPRATEKARELWVTLRIKLARPAVVGGVCFAGMPYIPSRLTTSGESSANCGLPREVRLTCLSGGDTGFIDADVATTKQDFIFHSGFHYVGVDPTRADTILLRLADFPSFAARVDLDVLGKPARAVEEIWGFALPYVYVFEYRERTRYRPIVAGGVVAARTALPLDGGALSDSLLSDYSFLVTSGAEQRYVSFTAGSLFGQGRTFTAVTESGASAGAPRDLRECFISRTMQQNESLTIFVQQGEEYPRCIAGMKVLLPFGPQTLPAPAAGGTTSAGTTASDQFELMLRMALGLPSDVSFCRRIGVKVYEIDPLDGVSAPLVPLSSKFATLLVSRDVDTWSEIIQTRTLDGLRFVRPSSARHFAIQLTNLDARAARLVLHDLDFIQSAHVTIHPRASRVQQVRTLNFRIIGRDLAADYAALGSDGFGFTIERVVAGERKQVLIRAASLIDLLHTGAAKLFANTRRRAVEFEKSEMFPAYHDDKLKYFVAAEHKPLAAPAFAPNYEERFTRSRQEGWRRAETGSGVGAPKHWETKPEGPFKAFSNQYVRTRNQLIYPDSRFFNRVRDFYDALAEREEKTPWIPAKEDIPDLWVDGDLWRGVPRSRLKVKGLFSVSASPLAFLRTSHFSSTWDILFDKLLDSGGLQFTGGSSSSISGSVGIISSTLGVNPYPTAQHQATYGTQGSLTRQAADTGYSYAQHRNEGYDEGSGYMEIRSGEMKRVVTRRTVAGTDDERVTGAEVLWQGAAADVVTGSIPLNFTLPATAGNRHVRTADDSLRVRLTSGVLGPISVDIWFDVTEEVIRDDY